jgi:hypothetical protein
MLKARARGDELADPPEADDPERLLIQLDAGVLGAIPFAFEQRLLGLRDVASEREQERHGVLGGGDDVGLRRIGDDDAALGGGLDVEATSTRPITCVTPRRQCACAQAIIYTSAACRASAACARPW